MERGMMMEKLYTVQEAAELVNYSQYTLYAAIRSGQLECYRPRGMKRGYRVTIRQLKEWLNGDYIDYMPVR